MNGVYETTTTSGTGTITLTAVTGRPRFSDAGVGELVPYAIKDGNNWEWGMGTVAATNTLVRAVVTATYVSGTYDNTSPTAITLSGSSADVYLAPIAENVSPGLPIVSSTYGRKAVFSSHYMMETDVAYALTADRLYLVPFKTDSAYDINGFYIHMTVAGAASTKARIGLYQMKSDGQPGEVIVETADIATDVTAGVLSPSVTQKRINPGWYFIALVNTGAPTYNCYNALNFGNSPLGCSSAASSMVPIQMLYKTIAGWSSLPANPTGLSVFSAGGSAGTPSIALKLV